eukprot:TRINITY_DN10375_c0_g1_i1.p1 TRINITY_DN10375_c0_g1~~TRINITY_DN10375_c0_g1_i1.p1  ORF type:complete len:988 (+),score=393.00 TRINITY_DN10375_c0_g1_i1:63-3026(+)
MAGDAEAQQMVQVLLSCMSPDSAVQKAAEAQLVGAKRAQWFVAVLAQVVTEGRGGVACQHLAVIALKNFVDAHWKVRGSFASRREPTVFQMTPEQHQEVRATALALLQSPAVQERAIVREVGHLVGRIARKSLEDWGELLPAIAAGIGSDDPHTRLKFFTALHHVFYEAYHASKGVPRAPFNKLCSAVAPAIVGMADQYNTEAAAATPNPAATAFCCLCHKIMTRALRGLHDPDVVQRYIRSTIAFLGSAVEQRLQVPQDTPRAESLDKVIKKAMKALTYAYIHDKATWTKEGYLLPLLQLATETVASVPPYAGRVASSFILQCLTVVKEVLTVASDNRVGEGTTNALNTVLAKNAQEFTERLLVHYLAVQQAEVDMWTDDPEAFVGEDNEDGEDDLNIKEVASNVFVGLLDYSPDTLVPPLAAKIDAMLKNPHTPAPQLESALHAVGLGCYSIPMVLDEATKLAWLEMVVQLCSHADKFARRRAIWVVGQWLYEIPPTEVDEETAKRHTVHYGTAYTLLVNVMANVESDVVIRLTALKAFQHFVECLDVELLLPLLRGYFTGVMDVLSKCRNVNLKAECLESIALVITTVGAEAFMPYAEHFIYMVQHLWQEELKPSAREEHGCIVMKKVLGTMGNIVNLLGHLPGIHGFLCGMVRHSCDPSNPDHQDVIEGGLALWHALLITAPSLTTELQASFEVLPRALEIDFASFDGALRVLHQYVVSGEAFLSAHGGTVVQCLSKVIASVGGNAEGDDFAESLTQKTLCTAAQIVEDMLVLLPNHAAQLVPVVGQMLADVEKGDAGTLLPVQVAYLGAVCRLVVTDKAAGMQLLASPERLHHFVANGLDLSDSMNRRDHIKLMAMAFTAVLTPPVQPLLEQFNMILQLVVTAHVEEDGEASAEFGKTCAHLRTRVMRYLDEGYALDDDDDTTGKKLAPRVQQLLQRDPVLCVGMHQWLSQQLAALHTAVGTDAYQQLLATVDPLNRTPLRL